ncbi:MAG: hypothetical protein DRN06_08790, partial [Thermoprotei archaeon]
MRTRFVYVLLALTFTLIFSTYISPSSSASSSINNVEYGPYILDKCSYVYFWVPCEAAGETGIAVRMIYPHEPRYSEGAPVVVYV